MDALDLLKERAEEDDPNSLFALVNDLSKVRVSVCLCLWVFKICTGIMQEDSRWWSMVDCITSAGGFGWLSIPKLQWSLCGAKWCSEDKDDCTSSKGIKSVHTNIVSIAMLQCSFLTLWLPTLVAINSSLRQQMTR